MKVLGNNVLIQPLPKQLVSPGGIHTLERYYADEKQWIVRAVGPGRVVRKKGKPDVLIAIELQPGDRVITNMYGGNKLVLPDGCVIIEADELIAKWRPGVIYDQEEVAAAAAQSSRAVPGV